jgi:hypothetical protein
MTVDKLGVRLYDRVSAVVAELVANAYDADAENVVVRVPLATLLARKNRITGEVEGYQPVAKVRETTPDLRLKMTLWRWERNRLRGGSGGCGWQRGNCPGVRGIPSTSD